VIQHNLQIGLCIFFSEKAAAWWFELSDEEKNERKNCIRIHVLSPFLFGIVPPGHGDKVHYDQSTVNAKRLGSWMFGGGCFSTWEKNFIFSYFLNQ
jgi:hypothetical protein